MKSEITKDAIIIGAGPIGLAMASRLGLNNFNYSLFEKGAEVGHHIFKWEHVPLFSNWEASTDIVSIKLIEDNDFKMSTMKK